MPVGSKTHFFLTTCSKEQSPRTFLFAKRGCWDPRKVPAMSTSPRTAGGNSPRRVGRCCQHLPKQTGQAARLTLQEELDLIHPVFSLCWARGCELERGSLLLPWFLCAGEGKRFAARMGDGDPGSAILCPVTLGKMFHFFISPFQTGKQKRN